MCRLRSEKVERVADDIPLQSVEGDPLGDLLVVSWGGTYGATHMAVLEMQRKGAKVSLMHLKYLNPLPKNLGAIFSQFKSVLVCELNSGQMHKVLNAKYNLNSYQYNKVQGQPFQIGELVSGPPKKPRYDPSGKGYSMTENPPLTKKDFVTDQDVRWCPGCGDYAILNAVQMAMAKMGKKREGHRFYLGDRLLFTVPLLYEHLRPPLHPREGPGLRLGAQISQPQSVRLGDHRGRGWPLDWRKPPDPRHPAQYRCQHPFVQQ